MSASAAEAMSVADFVGFVPTAAKGGAWKGDAGEGQYVTDKHLMIRDDRTKPDPEVARTMAYLRVQPHLAPAGPGECGRLWRSVTSRADGRRPLEPVCDITMDSGLRLFVFESGRGDLHFFAAHVIGLAVAVTDVRDLAPSGGPTDPVVARDPDGTAVALLAPHNDREGEAERVARSRCPGAFE